MLNINCNYNLVALTGYYRCGKTTLAKKWANAYGYHHIAFADKLKEICCSLYPHLAKEIYAKEKTKETRDLLSEVGLCYKIRFGEDCFIKAALENYSAENKIIVSDARFKVEFDYLAANGAKLYYLGDPTKDLQKYGSLGYDIQYALDNYVVQCLPKSVYWEV